MGGKGRKRTKFGRESGDWLYADRTPSPEKELEGPSSHMFDDRLNELGASGTVNSGDRSSSTPNKDVTISTLGQAPVEPGPGEISCYDEADTQDAGLGDSKLPVPDIGEANSFTQVMAQSPPPDDNSMGKGPDSYNPVAERLSLQSHNEEHTDSQNPDSPKSGLLINGNVQPASSALPEGLPIANREALPSVFVPTPPLLQVDTNIADNAFGLATTDSELQNVPYPPRLQPVDSAVMPEVSPLMDRKGKVISYVSADYEDQHEHQDGGLSLAEQSSMQEPQKEPQDSGQTYHDGSPSPEVPEAGLPDRQADVNLPLSTAEHVSLDENEDLQRPRSVEPKPFISQQIESQSVSSLQSSVSVAERIEVLISTPQEELNSKLVKVAEDRDSDFNEAADQMIGEVSDDNDEGTSDASSKEADLRDTARDFGLNEMTDDSEREILSEVIDSSSSGDEDELEGVVHEINNQANDDDLEDPSEGSEAVDSGMESCNEDDHIKPGPLGNVIDLTGENLDDEMESEEESVVSKLNVKDRWPEARVLQQVDGSDDIAPVIKEENVESDKFGKSPSSPSESGVPEQVDEVNAETMSSEAEAYAKPSEGSSVSNAFDGVREIADSYDDEDYETSDVGSLLDVADDPIHVDPHTNTMSTTPVLEDDKSLITAVTEQTIDDFGDVPGTGGLPLTERKDSTVIVIDLEEEPSSDPQVPEGGIDEQGLKVDVLRGDEYKKDDPNLDGLVGQAPLSSSPLVEEQGPEGVDMHKADNLDSLESDLVYPSSPPQDAGGSLPSSPPILHRDDQQDSLRTETLNTQLITPQATQQMLTISQQSTVVDPIEPVSPEPAMSQATPATNPTPFTPRSHKFVQDRLEEARRSLPEEEPSPFTPQSHKFVKQRLEEARRSLARARLERPSSDVPDVISPWFAPRKPVQLTEEEEESASSPSSIDFESENEQSRSLKPTESLSSPPSDEDLPVIHTQNGHLISSVPASVPPPPPTGLRTPLAYYAPLSTLSTLYNTTTSILAIALSSKPIERSKTGPRDYHTTLHITDPSSSPKTTTVQIFRPFKEALPLVEAGDAVLLRSFKVVSIGRRLSLISQAASAWAVFKGREVSSKGPPVELGAEERGFAKGLGEWWGSLGEEVKMEVQAAGQAKGKKKKEVKVGASEKGGKGRAGKL